MNYSKIFSNKKTIFLLKFFIIFFVIELFILVSNLSFYNSFLAFISSSYLGFLSEGNIIFINGTKFVVDNSCTGLVSIAILAGITFSLKNIDLFKKTKLFVFGSLILLLANIPRIMIVLISANIGFDAELIHVLTWFFMSVIVLLIWYFGLKNTFKIKDFSELL
ncbi:MAG: archaeosortase/exosortase family protein [Candidatus ainarchaeum sp.]|nr:archaeosortase/exosortase family protein [Candidatus ainarchaeum sp.]